MRFGGFAICALAIGCARSDNNAAPENPDLLTPQVVQVAVGQPVATNNYDVFREGIEFSASENALKYGVTSDHFNFSELRELWVRINVSGMSGTSVVRLTVTTPTGSVFYETTVPYSTEAGVKSMNVPKSPHPIDVYTARVVNGGHSLIYVVPVVGTALARYPIPGTWHIEATVEGHRTLSADIVVNYT